MGLYFPHMSLKMQEGMVSAWGSSTSFYSQGRKITSSRPAWPTQQPSETLFQNGKEVEAGRELLWKPQVQTPVPQKGGGYGGWDDQRLLWPKLIKYLEKKGEKVWEKDHLRSLWKTNAFSLIKWAILEKHNQPTRHRRTQGKNYTVGLEFGFTVNIFHTRKEVKLTAR